MASRSSADEPTAADTAAVPTNEPDLQVPVAADKGSTEDNRHEDLAVRAKDARRKAELSGDTADRVEADELEADLVRQGAVPDWREPDAAVAKATEIVAQFGTGLAGDDAGGWANMKRLLGYPLEELAAVSSSDRGVLWQVRDSGVWYIAIGAQNPPDGNGQRGIMMWQPPTNYNGPVPIYSATATPRPPFVSDLEAHIPPQGLPPGF